MLEKAYFVNEKGQMEFNFEALELVTSKEFANNVHRSVKNHGDFEGAMKFIHSSDENNFVVMISSRFVVEYHKFSYGMTFEAIIPYHELRELASMFVVMK